MRRFLQLFWAGLSAVIFIPILGGFFTELAKEQGWYEHPTARVETVMSWLFGIAFHPAYLFAAGLVLGLALGMWMDLALRRRDVSTPVEWWPLIRATEFARQDLLDRRSYVLKQTTTAMNVHQELNEQAEKAELATKSNPGADELFEFSQLYTAEQKAREEWQEWKDTLDNCNDALKMNIEHQLYTGELVAKGFLQPHTSGKPETMIPVREWGFLKLDWGSEKAVGPNVEYIAVLVGKPRAAA